MSHTEIYINNGFIDYYDGSDNIVTMSSQDDIRVYVLEPIAPGYKRVFTTTGGWSDENYRTITFDHSVTDTVLLTWLEANAIKQT